VLTRGGREETKAATDDLVWKLDILQYELGEGPCIDAMHGPTVVAAPHISQQDRWPNYVPEAIKAGLRSQLAVKLYLDDKGTLGGLNLYSTDCDEIDAEAEHLAELFAAHAAIALGSIHERHQLNQALESRKVIGMSLGMLMQKYEIDEDRAFQFLVRMSSHGGVKLRTVAQRVVDSANQRRPDEAPHPTSGGPAKPGAERLWVSIDTPQEVVASGLRHVLESEFGATLYATVGPVDGEPDVTLYDVIGLAEGNTAELDRIQQQTGSVVIAVSYDGLRPDLEALALELGAAAVIPLGVSAEELSEVIRAAVEGHLADLPAARTPEDTVFPGREAGLSRRESEILGLITQGRSNQEIAGELFLSINSVKTYIRSAYRKIGVHRRAQAVLWAIQHGFAPPTP
jgi:DNA-binding NarL/FixJ family response regulator